MSNQNYRLEEKALENIDNQKEIKRMQESIDLLKSYNREKQVKRAESKEKALEKIDARLLYITEARYGKDWHSIVHTHHFTELFFVTHGEGNFIVENQSFPVKENDLVIVNPNVSHTESGNEGTPLEYIVLGINGLQFKTDGKFDYSIHNFLHNREQVYFYLKALLHEVQTKEENFESICQNLLEILIWNIMRKTKTTLSVAPTKKITKECRFIEQYLDEHFMEDITLQTLSDLTYLNKYYLVHAFKHYKGISPINYLIEKRISEAKHLLDTTNYPIAKVASVVGFSSQSYFSQVFRKETGLSPNEYRKSLES